MSIDVARTAFAANLYKVLGRFFTLTDGSGRAHVYAGLPTVCTLRFSVKRTNQASHGERIDSIRIPYTIAGATLASITGALTIVDYTTGGAASTAIATTPSGFTLTAGDRVGLLTVDSPAFDVDADSRLYQLVLTLNGNATTDSDVTIYTTEVTHATQMLGTYDGRMISQYNDADQQTIAAGAGGAISVVTYYSDISTDAGGDAFTLAAGIILGQFKRIRLTTDGGGDATITGTFAGGTTLTMNDANDTALLMWNGSAWRLIENVGCTLA